MMLRVLLLAFWFGGVSIAEITPHVVLAEPKSGQVFGAGDLFRVTGDGVEVNWNSAEPNSYFFFPLGVTVTRADRFSFRFQLKLSEIAIGSSPGKPYTFQIAIGLLDLENAFRPEFFRGTGVNAAHGARNLVEWNYFPDSGFGATVAPSLATDANQIAFSDNHPVELVPGEEYEFELSFTPRDQTLRARMRRGSEDPVELKEIVVSSSFADFRLNALAISSYSDAGQTPPFAGSIQARGTVRSLQAVIYDRPQLRLSSRAGITFETAAGWQYFLEQTRDMTHWEAGGGPFQGTGEPLEVPLTEEVRPQQFYRIRGERIP